MNKAFAPAFGTALSGYAPSRCASRPSGLQSTGAEDLVELAAELRAVDLHIGLNEALALRKSRRERNSRRSLKGAETKRVKQAATLKPHFDLPADDWAPCPACGFILVACDCDAPVQLEKANAA